jgi:hypothetical protein
MYYNVFMALFASTPKTSPSHSLRVATFFLRVALGLNFFYLGWSTLFNPSLVRDLSTRSISDLYAWIGAIGSGNTQTLCAWAFLIIGACLMPRN